MARHNKCLTCKKSIVLSPSAEERAKNDVTGKTARYYKSLFTTCSTCTIASWQPKNFNQQKKKVIYED